MTICYVAVKTFVYFPSTCGFVVKRKKFPRRRRGVFKKTEIVLISVHLET